MILPAAGGTTLWDDSGAERSDERFDGKDSCCDFSFLMMDRWGPFGDFCVGTVSKLNILPTDS